MYPDAARFVAEGMVREEASIFDREGGLMPPTGTTARNPTAGARPAPLQFFCFLAKANVTEAVCAGFTRVPQRNQNGCCGENHRNNGRAPWRLCVACVRQGDVRKESLGVDDRGLCMAFHHKNGENAMRPKLPLPGQESFEDRYGDNDGPRSPSPLPPHAPTLARPTPLPALIPPKRQRRLATLRVDRIRPNPDQPRPWFDPAKLRELAE